MSDDALDPTDPADDASSDAAASAPGADARADDAVTDELPDDLDAAGYVGPYVFPDNNRRRIPGYLYVLTGAACLALWATAGDDAVLVNDGFGIVGAVLVVFGVYHVLAGFDLDVDERDALVHASRAVAFPVGHASAQLGWPWIRSRPTWRILLYSAEEPPEQRGFVLVDGVDGSVVEQFVEANPEDWSDLDGSLTSPAVASTTTSEPTPD